MTSPKLDQPVVDPLTVAQVRALLQTCQVDPAANPEAVRPLRHVRDEAIIRLVAETGIRLSEVIALTAGDLDLAAGRLTIRRGKGGRGRVIPIGPATGAAIRSYLSVRQEQRHADRPELWLGERSCGLAPDALYRSLRRRAERAGIEGFRPHRLRHTAAHRWLAAGGSESGLMAMAGWTRIEMLIRYTRAGASERAAAEARRLDLGNLSAAEDCTVGRHHRISVSVGSGGLPVRSDHGAGRRRRVPRRDRSRGGRSGADAPVQTSRGSRACGHPPRWRRGLAG